MKKKLTILDIAKLSGVGKSTVSRFFNNDSISQKSKEKIQKIIDEYGYTPNIFARNMKLKTNNLIGIIVPCFDSNITSTILMNLDNYLRKKKYIPLIINTNHTSQLELFYLDNLKQLNVSGIIILANEITENHKKILNSIDIPTIFIGQLYEDGYSIINNEEKAGKEIATHVIKQNFKNILYIGVSDSDYTVGILRKNSIKTSLEEKNINFYEIKSDFSFNTTKIKIEKLIKNNKIKNFDCIISATDNMMFGVISALKNNNFDIENFGLISYGGYNVSEILNLTTIKFFNDTTGKLAGESIINLIHNIDIPKIQTIDYVFQLRKSSINEYIKK